MIQHASGEVASERRPRSLDVASIASVCALAYVVLLGGTALGEVDPLLRLLNAVVAAAFVGIYLVKAPGSADLLDKGVLLALLVFLAAGVLSIYPRQSLDASLAALAYTAALFVGRGQLVRDRPRTIFIRAVIGLSLLLTILTAARWLTTFISWWALAEWRITPPLDLHFGAEPWGHRHDLALLVAMLYPAWLVGAMSPRRVVAACLMGILALIIVVLDGSRTLWFAVGMATVILIGYRVRLNALTRRAWISIGLVGVVAMAGALASGLVGATLDRLLNFRTVEARAEMWGALTDAWLAHPLGGLGPGSFPWALQTTNYFDVNSWAPRHPDSAVFQLLSEVGLLGAAAAIVVLVVVGAAIHRSRSGAARWALVLFVVAGLGANPTDFAFLVALAVGWVAYATPRRSPSRATFRLMTPYASISLACLAIIGIVVGMSLAASYSYERARMSVSRGDIEGAVAPLDMAILLDPGLALYLRQRGTLRYLQNEPLLAATDLRRAANINRTDDLAWRTLALAHRAAGDHARARAAIDKAVDVQRSDPTNLLLSSAWHAEEGRPDAAMLELAEVVQGWPSIVAAPEWSNVLPGTVSTADVVHEALERWQTRQPNPQPETDQGVWLTTLGGRPELLEAAMSRDSYSVELATSTAAAIECDAVSLGRHLSKTSVGDRRLRAHWLNKLRWGALSGTPDERAFRLVQSMGQALDPAFAKDTLNPLDENGLFSADLWGYRRAPIDWPDDEMRLPSPRAGMVRWTFYPYEAVEATGLSGRLPLCD